MMGTGTFAEPTFEALLSGPYPVVGLVTQPDRAAGAERGSTRQTGRSMKAIALERSLPVFQPESINTPEGIAGLKAMQPDLLVVAAYGQILSKEVLAVPAFGGVNVHASLLPKYRGAAPVAWAIYHGEKHSGVTIIRMSVALDAGDMLAQEAIDIGPDETAGELEARLSQVGARLVLNVLEPLFASTTKGIKQDPSLVTKAPKLTKEHGQINWNRTATEIGQHIRAMQPWPTAYTFFHTAGRPPLRLIITRARAKNQKMEPAPSTPGHVDFRPESSSSLVVWAAAGTQLEILELQPAGKRRMNAAEFVRGHPLHAGDHFGPDSA